MRFLIALVLLASLSFSSAALAQTDLIEAVSKQYDGIYPGLESYRVQLRTNKLSEMLNRMTASMPQDIPRPEKPELIKFWTRSSGTVVKSSSTSAFPYMDQMINRFSQRFAVDLGTLFLPAEKSAERAALLAAATVKSTETRIADSRIHRIDIQFKQPTDVSGAFYGTSLDLPQRKLIRLSLDIDPEKKVLVHMEIEADGQQPLEIGIRNLETEHSVMPREISITSPDGSIDEHFKTTFKLIEGYQLPVRQERKIRRPGLEEELDVEFVNYVLKKK